MSPRLLRLLLLPAVGLAAAVMLLSWFERAMIYVPTRGGGRDPASLGLAAEGLFLETEDGVRIHAWWCPGEATEDPVLLFLHGNAGNLTHRIELFKQLRRAGFHVLAPDYRGYGLSQGLPSEQGLYRDARAAYAELQRRGIPPERIVIHGKSLGAAVAAHLASERPCAGLVLESAFTSARDMACIMLGPLGPRLARSRFDTLETVGRLQVSMLIIHGERDEMIPSSMGLRLAEAAGERAELWLVPDTHHNDVSLLAGEEYERRLRAFAQRVTP